MAFLQMKFSTGFSGDLVPLQIEMGTLRRTDNRGGPQISAGGELMADRRLLSDTYIFDTILLDIDEYGTYYENFDREGFFGGIASIQGDYSGDTTTRSRDGVVRLVSTKFVTQRFRVMTLEFTEMYG